MGQLMKRKKACSVGRFTSVFCIIALLGSPVLANDPNSKNERFRNQLDKMYYIGEQRVTQPILHSESGSYFQLVDKGRGSRYTWARASAGVKALTHEGRRGRLAILDTPSKHRFVNDNFYLLSGNAWIGLRYMCASRTLIRRDGRSYDGSFAPWDRPWSLGGVDNCSVGDYFMGVYLTRNMRWQAVGRNKAWNAYIAEFPPSED